MWEQLEPCREGNGEQMTGCTNNVTFHISHEMGTLLGAMLLSKLFRSQSLLPNGLLLHMTAQHIGQKGVRR